MTWKTMLAVTALAVAGAGTAQAATVIRNVAVTNYSFEAEPLGDGQFCRGCTLGWASGTYPVTPGYFSDGDGQSNPPSSVMPATSDGANVGFVDTFVAIGAPHEGSLLQVLDETIVAGTNYTLTVDVGRRLDESTLPIWFAELVRYDARGATDLGTLAQGTLGSGDLAAGTFAPLSFGFTATQEAAGSRLGIRFRSAYNPEQGATYRGVLLDNVRLTAASDATAAVPEPAAWAMLITGFGMVGGTMRRRRATLALA